ncbi:hypothetical protein MHBO_002156 [Bonamia ostreae]|uniref:Serine aminopeptidase S33 domain-containing protein n=1 Tax=Bonamia ostreae TaxID=126728 RepID=A0ABV2ALE4_9EUKA
MAKILKNINSQYLKFEQNELGTSELMELPSINIDNEEYIIIMSPGNPGIIQIYQKFLESIYNLFNQKYKIFGLGYLGHSKIDLNRQKIYTVEDQIKNLELFIEKLIRKYTRKVKIVLIGHSMGAYINLKVIGNRPDFPIVYSMNLCAVLCKFSLAMLMKILSFPYLRRISSFLISKTPEFLKSNLASFLLNVKSYDEIMTSIEYSNNFYFLENALCTSDNIQNILRNDIPSEISETIKKNNEKILFVHTLNDYYVTDDVFEYVKYALHFANFVIIPEEENVNHAFIKNENYKKVTKICFEHLNRKVLNF